MGLCVVSLPDVAVESVERFGRVIEAFASQRSRCCYEVSGSEARGAMSWRLLLPSDALASPPVVTINEVLVEMLP